MDFAQFKVRLSPRFMPETLVLIGGPPQVRLADLALVTADDGAYELELTVPSRYYEIVDVSNDGRVWLAGSAPPEWDVHNPAHLTVEPGRRKQEARVTWAGGSALSVRGVSLVSPGGVAAMNLVLRLTRASFMWKGATG